MGYILFLVFFVTTADKTGQSAVWSLQSDTTMDFATEAQCTAVATKLISAYNISTVHLEAYCFGQGTPGSTDIKDLTQQPKK